MILTWMVYALLVSALIAVGARCVEELFRAVRLPVRFVWLAALLATLGLTALAPYRATLPEPEGAIPVVEASVLDGEGSAVASDGPRRRNVEALAVVRRALAWPLEVAVGSSMGVVAGALGLVWLGLALGLLVVGTATSLRYRSARRLWPLREVFGTEVRVAPAAGPAVLGVFRPEIVVPDWLLERSPSEQRLVVLHEREHVRAGDALTLGLGWLAAALVPWNPLTWWMLSRLRLAVELDCDARVLRRDVGREEYGSMLIDIAGRGSGLSLGVPALAGSPSNLERRLLAMTTRFSSRTMAVRAAGLGALGAVALLAACEARIPTSTEIEEMDVASAEAQAERLRLITPDSGVTYVVDGEEATAEEAHAIAADRLARVEVVRGAGAGGLIRLTTDPSGERQRLTVQADTPFSSLRKSFDGLMLIDGVDAGAELEGLKDLRPSDIERIEVLKGRAAIQHYDDPRAANGVIIIVTKEGAGSQ